MRKRERGRERGEGERERERVEKERVKKEQRAHHINKTAHNLNLAVGVMVVHTCTWYCSQQWGVMGGPGSHTQD